MRHKLLKKIAVYKLRLMECSKVEEEYPVIINGKRYRVDIVGFKDKEKIAIECGNCSIEKISELKKGFDKVFHFSFDMLDSVCFNLLNEYNQENKLLGKKLRELKAKKAPKIVYTKYAKSLSLGLTDRQIEDILSLTGISFLWVFGVWALSFLWVALNVLPLVLSVFSFSCGIYFILKTNRRWRIPKSILRS